MPSLFQRFARARDSTGGEDPPQRPKTSADELTATANVIPGPLAQPDEMPVTTDGDIKKTPEDSKDAVDTIPIVSIEGRKTADPDEVTIEAEDALAQAEEQQAVDPAASAAVAAELRKASQKAKAAAALKKMKARSGFSVWRWLPTFYDPIEDTVRSRIIAVLAVAVIPAMLTGLLLEPMITDVAAVTQNKAIVFSPLFLPMDPMYVGILPVQGYEFRFVVRNAKNWPKSGVAISASIRPNSTVLSSDLQRLLPACDPVRAGTTHHTLAGVCSATLEGNNAKTDAEGIAVFDKLKFREALPGSYQIVFSVTMEDAWTVPDIIQWVNVLPSTASLSVDPLEYEQFNLTNSFSATSGLVDLPPLTIRVAAIPGLSGVTRTLRIVAMEGSAAKYWVEISGKAPYSPLESIGAEAGVQLTGNTALVTVDAAYTLSAKISAWAQPSFMLLAVCDGLVAVIDAAPPAYLKYGVLLPPPVFSMPQLVVPAAVLTFDSVAFPSTLPEGATFTMKVRVPAAGLPSSLTLQGNSESFARFTCVHHMQSMNNATCITAASCSHCAAVAPPTRLTRSAAVSAASSIAANDLFKNVHPASTCAGDTAGGAFKRLIGSTFSSCASGTVQGVAVRICSFVIGFSVDGFAMPYKIIVAGLGGALVGISASITIRPIISNVHIFPSLPPQLFDSRVQQSTIQVCQRYSAPSLPFISITSSYTSMRNKQAIWALSPSSGPAVGILRTTAAPTGIGGGLELRELTLMSVPASVLSSSSRVDLTLTAAVDGSSHSLPIDTSSMSASATGIRGVMQQCGVTKAGWVSASVALPAEVAVGGALDGPVASVLDFQGNALANVRVCLHVGAFYNSTVVSCASSSSNGTAQLPPFVLPSVRFLAGAIMPWFLAALPLYSSSYDVASTCVRLAGFSFDDMETHSAVMFSGLGFSSCQICGASASLFSHQPIISLHPSPQLAKSYSGSSVSVYVHSNNSISPIDLSRFPNAARAAGATQQEVHVMLQCSTASNFVLMPSVTANQVVIPCPVFDGSSSSNNSDTASIQLLQSWDAEKFFLPLSPPYSVLETPAASVAAATGVLSWSVTSAAAAGAQSAATLVSVVLERPECSMYVLRVPMGAAASPIILLVFPSSITSLTVIAMNPQMQSPFVLIYGRQLSVNMTVDTVCDSQPLSRCKRERVELIAKNGSAIVPVFSRAVSSMPQRGFLINPIQNTPTIYFGPASVARAFVRLYPAREASIQPDAPAGLLAYLRPLQPPVDDSLIPGSLEVAARTESVFNGTVSVLGVLSFVTSTSSNRPESPEPLLPSSESSSAASSSSSPSNSIETFSIFNPLPDATIRAARAFERGVSDSSNAYWSVRQPYSPVFCVVVDRKLAAGAKISGTVVDSALGDDAMALGGIGVEWRVTAEAVATTLPQGAVLPSALGLFPFTGITPSSPSLFTLPAFNLPPFRDVLYTTPCSLPLLLQPGVYSLWGRVVSGFNRSIIGEFKKLAKLEVSNVVQALEFISAPSVMVVGVTYTVVIRAVGHGGASVSGALVLLQAFSNTGVFITACTPASSTCAATTGVNGSAAVPFTPLSATGTSHSLLAKSGSASATAFACLSIAPTAASLTIAQPLSGSDDLGYAAVTVPNASKVQGAILASGDTQADLQGMQLPELVISDVLGRPINQLRASISVYPGEGCTSFMQQEMTQQLNSVTFRTVRFQASKQSYLVDGIQFHPNGTDTGMYCAIFESSGLLVAQSKPFIVRNTVAPDPVALQQLRNVLYLGLFSLAFTFNANLVSSNYLSFLIATGASGLYALLAIVYADSELKFRGGLGAAPIFNQGALALMLLVVVLLSAYCGLLLVLWLFKTDFFDDRQSIYRATLKSIFLKDKAGLAADAAAARQSQDSTSSKSKVLPTVDPKAALAAAKLRIEALKKKTWRQHLADARVAAALFVNWIMGIPPGSEAMNGMFFVPVRFLSAAAVSFLGVFVYILVAESGVRWVFTMVYQRRALVVNDQWAAARFSAASTLGNIIASPAYPLSPHRASMYNQYDIWAVVYTVLRNFGQDVAKVDDFANSVRSACTLSFLAAFAAYLYNWIMMTRSYRATVLSVRAGQTRIDGALFHMTDASAFVGRQLWSSILSLLLLQVPLSLVIFVFLWGTSRSEVFSIGIFPVAILLLCEGFMALLRFLITRFVVKKNLIQNRTLFSLYELIGTFLHLPGGIVATIVRFSISYFDMALAFGRLDVPISLSHPESDQGHSAYMAAVLCDIKFNSPFSSVLAHDVANLLIKNRRKRQQLGVALEKDFNRTTAALQREQHSRSCRNQWLQLYTVMSNPQLTAIRRSTMGVKANIDKINAQMQESAGSGSVGIAAVQRAKTVSKALAAKVRAAPKL